MSATANTSEYVVEQVLPDWVDEGPDGYKRLTVRGFEALAVEALREVVQEKDAQIAALEQRVQRLEAGLAQLASASSPAPAGTR